jgi:hypothetical protein
MSCTQCGDEHLAADEDCLLADVPTSVPEQAPQPAPDASDWDAAGVPLPDDFDPQDGGDQ